MESNKVKALLIAVHMGSFTKAAEKLGYTQSGLTHMMNSLEKEIGFQLLQRGRFGVSLTSDGQRLLPMLREFLKWDTKIRSEIVLINKQKKGNIRIGAYSSISKHWLPTIVRDFQKLHPDVNFEIKVGGMDEIYAWLNNCEVELCFVSSYAKYNYEFITLKDDQYMAVLPEGYPLESAIQFPIEKVDGVTFIMPSFGTDNDVQVVLDEFNIKPFVKTTSVDDSAVLSMVAHGLGVSILSELVLRGHNENVITVPLQPASYRQLGIAMRSFKEATPMAKKFIALAKIADL
ncbi:LysR family transcriptional regulator [Clostridium algoriphilum]|uniref:LysR family transcriptional regulator n=1 Tax=Clostridium algoriphilum TaxID=198347 RepID=UPI001CF4F60D|nr:LysR family transcriptional regulator [Clostridium algoriphilum]MCB2294775.1 LysR family transcriptional regulator [Clostridium algoriphilum]